MTTNFQPKYIPRDAKVTQYGNAYVFEAVPSEIVSVCTDLYINKGLPLKLIEATDERAAHRGFRVWYVFGVPGENAFIVAYIQIDKGEEFISLAPSIHEAGSYERKIRAFFGLNPIGNPDPRRTILHENWPDGVYPLRKDFDWRTRPKTAHGSYEFHKVEGEGIYELPVGPIHAGIIEPGHFRFSVAGEEIILLEPRLGYVHKGTEKLFERLPLSDKVRLSEKVSGDSSFSHSLAFCMAVEQLAGLEVPEGARYLRTIYAELERISNHLGDIGMIMLDAGFNFGGSQGGRLREMIMRVNERLTGSRFLRGVNEVGGVTKDISIQEQLDLPAELEGLARDFGEVIDIAENTITLLNRLKGAGTLAPQIAKDHGAMGVAGRAVGIAADARIDYPYAAYGELGFGKLAQELGGDVYSRFRVRVKEVEASFALVRAAIGHLPAGPISAAASTPKLARNSLAITLVEGWRGEVVCMVWTDSEGEISRVALRDPSFINWQVVGFSGAGNMIPDFPLINKSYNQSYSGNDL